MRTIDAASSETAGGDLSNPFGRLHTALDERRRALLLWWRGFRARGVTLRRFFLPRLKRGLAWWWSSREQTNFTYALTARNRRHLAHALALACGVPAEAAWQAMAELMADSVFRARILERRRSAGLESISDPRVEVGRRLAWYAAVRLTRPRLVIETGVDKGLGAAVLCAALLRNAAEGYPGRYLGTDIDPGAGRLLGPPYDTVGRILYGDSIASLETIDGPIDLFINDSDHSGEYEAREYRTIEHKLAPGALIIGDNAHVTDALVHFAEATGRHFLFVKEVPTRTWYPGDGIGFAFHDRRGDGR